MSRTQIDWKPTQTKIGANPDGKPGRETYGKLFARVVQRDYRDEVFTRLGDAAARSFPDYVVNTRERVAAVIAIYAHESADFRRFEENLNYSPQRLAEVWPGRYAVNPKADKKVPNAKALKIGNRPQDIANETYGLRMGNVDGVRDNDKSPDGWQYRGRGPGLTGKANYMEIGDALNIDLLHYPDLASDPGMGLTIMLEFAKRRGIFKFTDAGDDRGERMAWNGGLIGYQAVETLRDRALSTLVFTGDA